MQLITLVVQIKIYNKLSINENTFLIDHDTLMECTITFETPHLTSHLIASQRHNDPYINDILEL